VFLHQPVFKELEWESNHPQTKRETSQQFDLCLETKWASSPWGTSSPPFLPAQQADILAA